MNKGSISGENRGFDRRAFPVEGAPIERNVNDIFEVQINWVGSHCVGEPIERLLMRSLEFSEDSYDFVNSRLVHQTARSPDDQTNVFVKLDVWWKLYVIHFIDLTQLPRSVASGISSSSGTPSHCAASLRSWNTRTLIEEP